MTMIETRPLEMYEGDTVEAVRGSNHPSFPVYNRLRHEPVVRIDLYPSYFQDDYPCPECGGECGLVDAYFSGTPEDVGPALVLPSCLTVVVWRPPDAIPPVSMCSS